MPKSQQVFTVMIDTSFLITLSDKSRPNHETAKRYYKEFIKRECQMLLSTIVMSEYHQRQPVTDLIASGNFMPVPYNYNDAIRTAELAFNLGGIKREQGERANAKDDVKIIAQADVQKATYLITDDDGTMFRYCSRLTDASMIAIKPIKLSDGFDSSLFSNGQTSIID